MFTLFHFGFELVKIAILAAFYASIIFAVTLVVYKVIKKRTAINWIVFMGIHLSIAVSLLVFSFTYYGDHGLGDDATIPLGHFTVMNSSDGYAYFETSSPYDQISVDNFLVKDDNLCMVSGNELFICQLQTGKMKKFADAAQYNSYALAHNLPRADHLRKFWPQYDDYWNGWRFWLLP
jgi:energy-coupling factor transporter transmembrane protein EcfT